jgi:hypothetical protein
MLKSFYGEPAAVTEKKKTKKKASPKPLVEKVAKTSKKAKKKTSPKPLVEKVAKTSKTAKTSKKTKTQKNKKAAATIFSNSSDESEDSYFSGADSFAIRGRNLLMQSAMSEAADSDSSLASVDSNEWRSAKRAKKEQLFPEITPEKQGHHLSFCRYVVLTAYSLIVSGESASYPAPVCAEKVNHDQDEAPFTQITPVKTGHHLFVGMSL